METFFFIHKTRQTLAGALLEAPAYSAISLTFCTEHRKRGWFVSALIMFLAYGVGLSCLVEHTSCMNTLSRPRFKETA